VLKGIRLIIFDLDGTLVDAYPAISESFNFTMARLGYPSRSGLTIRKAVGWGDRNLLRPFVKSKDLESALALYRGHHSRSLLRKSRLIRGVPRLLKRLKQKGYLLAVASNRPTRFSRIIVRHLRLDRYLDYLLCADRLAYMKPHPEILMRIMRRLKADRRQTLFVGDMTVDAEAGRRAGVATVIVTTGSSSSQEIRRREKSCRIIRSLAGLKGLV